MNEAIRSLIEIGWRDGYDENADKAKKELADMEAEITALKTEMETKNMAASHALDLIAKLFSIPDWEYPAQVVRDIENEITKFICSSCYEIFDSRTLLGMHQSQKIHDELEDFTKDTE